MEQQANVYVNNDNPNGDNHLDHFVRVDIDGDEHDNHGIATIDGDEHDNHGIATIDGDEHDNHGIATDDGHDVDNLDQHRHGTASEANATGATEVQTGTASRDID